MDKRRNNRSNISLKKVTSYLKLPKIKKKVTELKPMRIKHKL